MNGEESAVLQAHIWDGERRHMVHMGSRGAVGGDGAPRDRWGKGRKEGMFSYFNARYLSLIHI